MKSAAIACCLILPSVAALQAADWTDRKEYDLVLTIRSESSPEKRLVLLDSWSKNYPKTALSGAREELYLSTYDSLSDRPHMFAIARQMLAEQPKNPVALYWLTVLAPQQPNPSSEIFDVGEKAARQLLANVNDYFAAGKRPPMTADADWQKQRAHVEVLAQRTMGWAEWQRGNFGPATESLSACLKKDPGNAEISSWLGIVAGLDSNRQPLAIWHLARATSPALAVPLPEEQRRQVNTMLETVYVSYHGSAEGLEQIRKIASANPFPPAEFTIDPATVVNARRAEAELSQTNPELAAWLAMKRQLEAPDGEKYFANDLQGKALAQLSGTVIRALPAKAPREVTLAMTESSVPEVTLKLTIPLTSAVRPGVKLTFQGNGDAFTKNPLSLVITADSAHIVEKQP